MMPAKTLRFLALTALFFISISIQAQVKIGGNEKEAPHPSAVLELKSADRGLLLPRLSQKEMIAIKEPANALVIYNTDARAVYIYSADQQQWMSLMQPVASRMAGDSCEWVFDSATARVFLVRGYPAGDSIFYSTDSKKFVFSDRTMNTNSLGQDFPVTSFGGKYYFKATASRFTDTLNINPTMLTAIFEIDSTGQHNFFRGMNIATVNNPRNTQPLDQFTSLQLSTIHAGQDSVLSMMGFGSSTVVNGNGFTGTVSGINNSTLIQNLATNNISSISGIRNALSNSSPTSKVLGNAYGYFGTTFLLDTLGLPIVNGNLYGIFLSNIHGAGPRKNFAFYSSKGLNRFGDSTLITDIGAITPRAVFDINASSAMIPPAGSTLQRPTTPVAAMLRYNSTLSAMEFYNGSVWKSMTGNEEWQFDNLTNRVNLVRALPVMDTIFYNPVSRKFVFSDRYTNTNSLGSDFPVENFNAKYTFKSTASLRDTSLWDGASVTIVYEADNSSLNRIYTALSTSAVMNPKAFQKSDMLVGMSNSAIHAGNDSVYQVAGINNTARNSGNGSAEEIVGIQNLVRIQNGINNNAGQMIGVKNIMSRTGATAGRVTGNVYGWMGTFSGFTNSVDGFMYGVYINSVTGALPKRNYAFYSSKGHNRFGDSTLITDGFLTSPRAVLDVNSTSAMIVPTGTTVERPAGTTGMVRYNTTNQTLETFSGTQWNGMIRGSVTIDIPFLNPSTGTSFFVTVSGATTNSVVCVSPTFNLTAGTIIAWARVSSTNQIEIRFENNSSAGINPASQVFQVRVIQ